MSNKIINKIDVIDGVEGVDVNGVDVTDGVEGVEVNEVDVADGVGDIQVDGAGGGMEANSMNGFGLVNGGMETDSDGEQTAAVNATMTTEIVVEESQGGYLHPLQVRGGLSSPLNREST
uniref:Uncharacterized protein n=1 Tax=Bracon brevicornis TaxID=1563983 RepID=A0A6V7KV08_9HYME